MKISFISRNLFVGIKSEKSVFITMKNERTNFVKYQLCVVPCITIHWASVGTESAIIRPDSSTITQDTIS